MDLTAFDTCGPNIAQLAFDCSSCSICAAYRVKAPKSNLISYSVKSSTPVSFGITAVIVPKAFLAVGSLTACRQRT